jgi:alpha-beta hydrolase superfamily lysophospholipase
MITDDHLRQSLAPNTLVVIIAPGYGQTALDAMILAYYLAHYRLRILRYNHTNHVGLSDGELQQTTLRSMQADLLKVVEFVQHTWPAAPLIVMASDMTARVALKMAVQSRPLDLLLLINQVVDIQAMLMTVHGHDLVADHRYGIRRGIANLLGQRQYRSLRRRYRCRPLYGSGLHDCGSAPPSLSISHYHGSQQPAQAIASG